MDASNIDCKLWPRMGSIQERLWSSSEAVGTLELLVDAATGNTVDEDLDLWLKKARYSNTFGSVFDRDGSFYLPVFLSTSGAREVEILKSAHARYAAWRDLMVARGIPASPLSSQWVKPSLSRDHGGDILLLQGLDPLTSMSPTFAALEDASSSSLREVSTSTQHTSDHARGQCSGVD